METSTPDSRFRKRKRQIYEVYSSSDSETEPTKKRVHGTTLVELEKEAKRDYYRQYRANRTPVQKQRAKTQARERMRRHRNKLKEEKRGVHSRRKSKSHHDDVQTQRDIYGDVPRRGSWIKKRLIKNRKGFRIEEITTHLRQSLSESTRTQRCLLKMWRSS